jgi:hypothetical protein
MRVKDMVKCDDERGAIEVLPRERVLDLLRRFGGLGGDIVADDLDYVTGETFVGVRCEGDWIELITHEGGRLSERVVYGYDCPSLRTRRGGKANGVAFSEMYFMMCPDGSYVPVGGRDAADSWMACLLVSMVMSRKEVLPPLRGLFFRRMTQTLIYFLMGS